MIFGERATVLDRRLWTVADEPYRVSHILLRWCSKIFFSTSHTVGDNKLCVIYLIIRLDLKYIMGSQWQRRLFELLELLSALNMQLYERCLKIWNYSGFVWTFLYGNLVFCAFQVHNSKLNHMHMLWCTKIACK